MRITRVILSSAILNKELKNKIETMANTMVQEWSYDEDADELLQPERLIRGVSSNLVDNGILSEQQLKDPDVQNFIKNYCEGLL